MKKFRFLACKDLLLLVRDRAGLAMMFLMPMLLAVIMTYLQDSTFNAINETQVPLLLLNHDEDALGAVIEEQIGQSKIFDIHRRIDGKVVAKNDLIEAVAKGRYMVGIFIPANATQHIRKSVKQHVAKIFSGQELPAGADSVQIEIYLDPTTKSSFRATLTSTLKEYATRTEAEFIFSEMITEVKRLSPMPIANVEFAPNRITLKEQYATLSSSDKMPNSVQHNIPAWSMFAIFFITISLSGNIINEREAGSYTRLRVMPCPHHLYLFSKIAVYLAVCVLQYAALFLIGIFAFPCLGLPAFEINAHYAVTLLMGISSALAAIGYGVLIGKVAGTHQQAAIFAAISVVIMAAVGGVWIPTFVMPETMRIISNVSPLNWGLEGFYDIFVRELDWSAVLPESITSLLFFGLCLSAAIIYDKKKRIDL
jgi:ABC-2 type transport system permease protein